MAHYDCSHCGSSMGIAYGYCTDCTPKEVFVLEKKKNAAHGAAERAWNVLMEVEMLEFKKQKASFISQHVKKAADAYQEAYDRGKKS